MRGGQAFDDPTFVPVTVTVGSYVYLVQSEEGATDSQITVEPATALQIAHALIASIPASGAALASLPEAGEAGDRREMFRNRSPAATPVTRSQESGFSAANEAGLQQEPVVTRSQERLVEALRKFVGHMEADDFSFGDNPSDCYARARAALEASGEGL